MKNKSKALLILALSAISILGGGCSNQSFSLPSFGSGEELTWDDIHDPNRPDGDFDYDDDYVPVDPPEIIHEEIPDLDPAYEAGSETSVTRMEAENAYIDFVGSNSATWRNEFSDVDKLAFDFRLSNKLCTRNLNDSWQGGTSINFNFTSSESYLVKVKALISTHDSKTDPYVPSEQFKVKSEGKNDKGEELYSYADLSELSIPRSDSKELVSGGEVNSEYFYFAEIEFYAAIYKGETLIKFEFDGSGKGCNLDYIEIDTSSEISGFDNDYYQDGDKTSSPDGKTSEWYVSKAPTEEEAGTFSAQKYIAGEWHTYSYGLPALLDEDGNLTDGYTKENDNSYSFDFKNDKVNFTPGQALTSTISISEESVVKFANGATSITKEVGDTIDATDFELPADKGLGLIIAYDRLGHDLGPISLSSWTVPTYGAILEVRTLVPAGYTQYNVGDEQGSRLPNPVYGGAIKANFTISSTYDTFIHGTNEDEGLYGSIVSYNGTLTPRGKPAASDSNPDPAEADTQFRLATHIGKNDNDKPIVLNKEHSFIYYLENFGTTRMHLRLNVVNSGNSIEPNDEGVDVDLEPGESLTAIVNIKFTLGSANRNTMALFTVLEDIENMKLGIALIAKLGK